MSWGDPISDRQVELVKKLYSEIDPDLGPARASVFLAEDPTRRQASAKIDLLIEEAKKAKVAPAPVAAAVAVPAARGERAPLVFPEPGYYAVEYQNALRFYRVKEGKGYYTGRKFLDRFKSDELRSISMAERMAVLDLINEDPAKAGMRFAVELTRCHICGRMLTDEISRLRGIGPDCFGRRAATHDEIGMHALGSL